MLNIEFDDIKNQINTLVKEFDKIDDIDKIENAVKTGAILIRDEQRNLIKTKSSTLANSINIKKSKKGISFVSGYDSEAINKHPEAPIFEFGRPGKKQNKTHMNQTRNGKKVKVKIGKISAVPHIFLGFERVKNEAFKKIADELRKSLK